MREQIVDLTKSLSKGLRAFQDKGSGAPMLDECHNFSVGEIGLEEYIPLHPIGAQQGLVNYYNYLHLRDQVGKSWYWYPVFDGHILVGDEIPEEPGLEAVPIDPQVYEWLEVLDEHDRIWKLYPDPTTGETRATDSTPLSGIGLADMVWRGTTGQLWLNRFSDLEKSRYAQRVVYAV